MEEIKWTDKDLCEFAEWCSLNDWTFDGLKWNRYDIKNKNTSQLQEIWEIETGRRAKP